MIKEILHIIEENSFRCSIITIDRLKDVQLEFETNYKQGIFDEEFFQERISVFKFNRRIQTCNKFIGIFC